MTKPLASMTRGATLLVLGGLAASFAQAATSWVPQVSDTWEWQLSPTKGKSGYNIDTKYAAKVYDFDLEDAAEPNNDSLVKSLHASGHVVVCYFSAGSYETGRSDTGGKKGSGNYGAFQASDLGNKMSGWPEWWIDTNSANVRAIMKARIVRAAQAGCDGVEPDNVDGYTNNPGFSGMNAASQLDYNRFLATTAHANGLKIALKNDIDQVPALSTNFDFAINEQCNQYKECGNYSYFTGANKPVFNAEYASKYKDASGQAALCKTSIQQNLRTLVLNINLDDSYHYSCDGAN